MARPSPHDDYTGPRRPLIGFDASSSIYHLTAVALGWRDAGLILERDDFKTLMAGAIDELAKAGKIDAPVATPKQRRNAMGALANISYGAGLAGIVRKLRGDATKYGTHWGNSKNLQALLDEGRKINHAIEVVLRMREEVFGSSNWDRYRTAWERAVKRAKLADLHWHDLRRTFASWAVQRRVSLYELKELLGHSSLTMVKRYAHLAPEHLRAAAALDGVLTPAVGAADLSEREVHSKETAS